ncbi:MAG: uracil-DNA glycosylase [Alphaproteobacteria bacterium]|nr:uracil-DNA glycosylase [Alphaproteobacteria bacterium]
MLADRAAHPMEEEALPLTISPLAEPQAVAAPLPPPVAAGPSSRALADTCTTISELEEAVRGFDGCSLKRFATRTVFADGIATADLMVIGEAPGAQEDQEGIPFCGPSGKLLDKMLRAIGRSREGGYYITNMVFWRPPGNRTPNPQEIALCLPFVEKHIALVKPKALLLAGATPTKALLATETSVSRLRGKKFEYRNVYLEGNLPCFVTYHPSYLLRQPSQKRQSWIDMLTVQAFLRNTDRNPA